MVQRLCNAHAAGCTRLSALATDSLGGASLSCTGLRLIATVAIDHLGSGSFSRARLMLLATLATDCLGGGSLSSTELMLIATINSRGRSGNESKDFECENHNSPADSRPIVLMAPKLAVDSAISTVKSN